MLELDIPTSIYIDTNILQEHFNNKKRFLDGFKLSRTYYDLVKYIDEYLLTTKVRICIPQIVIEEMKEHLFKDFRAAKQSLRSTIEDFEKIFGDLLELNYDIKYYDDEDYKNFILEDIESIKKDANNSFVIVEYPECFPKMIENALKMCKPFAFAKGNGKDYSDAGFKDALMIESIIDHCNLEDENIILYTKDDDFKDIVNHKNFSIARELKDVIDILDKIYKIDPIIDISLRVEKTYHRELLLATAECVYDNSITDFKVINIEELNTNQYSVTQECTINETNYKFTYIYDLVANEIINCIYEITND